MDKMQIVVIKCECSTVNSLDEKLVVVWKQGISKMSVVQGINQTQPGWTSMLFLNLFLLKLSPKVIKQSPCHVIPQLQ